MNEFESHWVPHLFGLVLHLNKKLSNLLLSKGWWGLAGRCHLREAMWGFGVSFGGWGTRKCTSSMCGEWWTIQRFSKSRFLQDQRRYRTRCPLSVSICVTVKPSSPKTWFRWSDTSLNDTTDSLSAHVVFFRSRPQINRYSESPVSEWDRTIKK